MHLPETVFDNLVCDETELNKNLKDQLVNLHKEIKLKFAEIQLGLREKINEINSQKITTIQVDIDFKLFSEDTVKEYFKKKLEEYYKNLITREKVYDIKETIFPFSITFGSNLNSILCIPAGIFIPLKT